MMLSKKIFLITAALAVVACSKPAEKAKPMDAPPDRTDVSYLTPAQHLIRVSLDLRGTRPSIQDIEAVEANPKKIREFIRAYLEDPRFAERVKEIWNEGFLTRTDRPHFPGPPELRAFLTEDDFSRAGGNEPLEMVAYVVTQDRPFTEVVNADYTVANGVLSAYYDIKRPDTEGIGWVASHYTDGRPESGVLSSTAFHTRFTTTDSNQNRGRANAWTRAVLCYDFMSRDIIVDTAIDLSDPNVVNNAVRTNPSCVGCHQALDPLASHFFGYFIPENVSEEAERSYPIKTYSADLENRWQQGTGRGPGYFGFIAETEDGASPNLKTLGAQMAGDPRFSLCATKRFLGAFTGHTVKEVPFAEMDRLHDWFVKTDYNAKALIEEILMSPDYRIAGPLPSPAGDTAADVHGLKLLAPEQLNRMLADLGGFAWKLDYPLGYNLLENDIYGFRMMSGGFDSLYVTAPSHTINATHVLTLRMAAADAASKAVDTEFALSRSSRRLLNQVETTDVSEAAIRAQAVTLYKALYGEVITPDSVDAGDVNDLWQKVNTRTGDPAYAWKVTLAAMFSDLRIAFY